MIMFGIALCAALVIAWLIVAIILRRVVEPNEVHIVQRANETKSYGKDTPNGNTYYEWPRWRPSSKRQPVLHSLKNLPSQSQIAR